MDMIIQARKGANGPREGRKARGQLTSVAVGGAAAAGLRGADNRKRAGPPNGGGVCEAAAEEGKAAIMNTRIDGLSQRVNGAG